MKRVESPEFEVRSDSRSVIAYAVGRLQPETGGWQSEFKAALQKGMEELETEPDRILFAEYGNAAPVEFFDVENALFYSLGTAVFKKATRQGLFFRIQSRSEAELALWEVDPRYRHFYAYRMVDGSEKPGLPIQPAIRWDKVPIQDPSGAQTPYDYWIAMRANLDKIFQLREADLTGPYGVQLTIRVPDGESVNLAEVMGPMLDGILCAFHRFPGDTNLEDLDVLGQRIGIPMSLLGGRYRTILGEQVYVTPYKDGVRWLPQNNRCTAVDIAAVRTGGEEWGMDGGIYAM